MRINAKSRDDRNQHNVEDWFFQASFCAMRSSSVGDDRKAEVERP